MLNVIPWNKELETGIEILDEQHMNFFKMSNRFAIKYMANKKTEAVMEELEFLEDYLMYHFQTEETFQIESNYPGYLDHQAEHKRLIFQVKAMSVALKNADKSNREKVLQDFAEFVNDWVKKHILNLDLDFSLFYKSSLLENTHPQ